MSSKNQAIESDSASIAPICVADLEQLAKKKLDKMTWEYYYHGAADELTRLDNQEAFNRYESWRKMLTVVGLRSDRGR